MRRVENPYEFKKRIEEILQTANGLDYELDVEIVHKDLDEAMEDLLIDLGYTEAIRLIRNTERWYR